MGKLTILLFVLISTIVQGQSKLNQDRYLGNIVKVPVMLIFFD